MSTDFIYSDIDFVNQSENDKDLVFQTNRNDAYLNKPSDYYMNIERFEISNTTRLPVFIPQIQPNQIDASKTVYEVMIADPDYNYTSGKIPIIYTSENPSVIKPGPVGPIQDNDSYYYYYTYQHFCEDLNQALHVAMESIRHQTGKPNLEDPYFIFNNETKKFTLFGIKGQFDQNQTNDKYYGIFINEDLHSILASFQYYSYKVGPPTHFDMPYAFVLTSKNQHGNIVGMTDYTTIPPPNAPKYYITATSQDLDISVMNPISSIVFTADDIPVVPTNASTTNEILYNNQSNLTVDIITDFQVPITATNSYRPTINYSPSVYRYFSLDSATPLSRITIRAHWKDKYGRMTALPVPPKSHATMKIAFRKKTAIA
jgi:hypothetical protein